MQTHTYVCPFFVDLLVLPPQHPAYLEALSSAQTIAQTETMKHELQNLGVQMDGEGYLKGIPNINTCDQNSVMFSAISELLLKLANNLSNNAVKHLKSIVNKIEKSGELDLLAVKLLLLYFAFGKLMLHGPYEEKMKIMSFLKTNSQFSSLPVDILEPLFKLRQFLNSDDRAERVMARNLCNQFDIPLEVSQMIKLSIDGIKSETVDDLVLVIGATGSGKSTMINYLTGVEYELKEDPYTGSPYLGLTNGSKRPYAEAGHTSRSQTLYPQIIKGDEGISFCDTPGFQDSRENEAAVCAALGVPLAVHFSKSFLRGPKNLAFSCLVWKRP